jgi:predicted lysophospholipase L1 biosynthesis ABC-type transport system permease subunit
VLTAEDLQLGSFGVLGEAGRIVALGTFGTLLMAGCSLAISVCAGIIDRRRPLALLRLTGMPLGRMRATMLLEAGTPLIVTAVISAALGVLAGEFLLQSLASVPVPPPDPWLIGVLCIGLLAAMLVVAGTLPLLGRVTSTEATRFE